MKLGKVLRKWRVASEIDLRTIGKETGLDASTWLRIEQGKDPSAKTLRKILLWLLDEVPRG